MSRLTANLRKLRPGKVRSALRRRWFERRLESLELRDLPGVVELGSVYGGWKVPGSMIEPSWVCYSVGAGGDISFDRALIERFGVSVRGFDAVQMFVDQANEETTEEPRFLARQAAIATHDGPIRMQVSHDPHSSSVSSAGLYTSHDFVELPGRTLESLMAELGDERIDLLKLDIEGAEYEVLPGVDLKRLGVKVFATQLHHTGSVGQAQALIAGLGAAGYEPVACRPAVKVTFVRADLIP
jgi:FkbM family methyltransferase